MIISFVTGLTIDIFEGQLGLHSNILHNYCLFKTKILSILSNSKTLSNEENIRLNNLGILILVYSSTLIFLHSLIYFLLLILKLVIFLI